MIMGMEKDWINWTLEICERQRLGKTEVEVIREFVLELFKVNETTVNRAVLNGLDIRMERWEGKGDENGQPLA